MIMEPYMWQVGVAVIGVLGSINAYFISRLISRIDKSSEVGEESARQIAALRIKVEQLSDMSHRMTVIEKQMAVFEYLLKKDIKE